MDRARFFDIVRASPLGVRERPGIGTYKEKQLHLILKKYFEDDPAYHEVETNGFIADIRRGDLITEIETSGFSGLKPKLSAYLPEYRVRLVHPLAGKKYVSWIDPETREISPRNRSPKKEGAYELLFEMVRILPFVAEKRLTVLGPVFEMDEYRMKDGWGRDGKRGSHRYERIPVDFLELIELSTDADYRRYIPDSLPEVFGVKDFALGAKIRADLARPVIRVMEARGLIRSLGKEGRSLRFSRS